MKYGWSHEDMINSNRSFGYILSLELDWVKTKVETHQEKTCEALEGQHTANTITLCFWFVWACASHFRVVISMNIIHNEIFTEKLKNIYFR